MGPIGMHGMTCRCSVKGVLSKQNSSRLIIIMYGLTKAWWILDIKKRMWCNAIVNKVSYEREYVYICEQPCVHPSGFYLRSGIRWWVPPACLRLVGGRLRCWERPRESIPRPEAPHPAGGSPSQDPATPAPLHTRSLHAPRSSFVAFLPPFSSRRPHLWLRRHWGKRKMTRLGGERSLL